MTVTGINGDLYYANNPIFIKFDGINPDTKYIEIFPSTNGPQQGLITPQRLYVFGQNTITIDISQTVKLFFPDVTHNTDYTTLAPFVVLNNWRKIQFVIKEVLSDGTVDFAPSITKTFVKGGNRTYDSNQNTSVNQFLSPVNTIPVWGGFPIDYAYFNMYKQLTKHNKVQPTTVELRKIKGCDPLYIKFLNSKGWYSYWLFENWETQEKTKNLGFIKGSTHLQDLGNEAEIQIEVTSKVPKRFLPMMFDLADSQEIYIYRGSNKWERVINGGNKVSQNLYNTNEKVKLKFDVINRYNPSLIW